MTQIKYTKRIGHLFEKMIDRDNLKLAIQNAARRKRNRASVRRVLNDIEKYTDKLYEILSSESFNPHQYAIREINDGIKKKKRIIAVPRFFPDQCIHHAFVQIFKEVVTHSAYEYSCGCVPGKGTDGARKVITHWIKTDPAGTSKVAQLDVKHCYPTLSHAKLQGKLKKRIKDKRFLRLAYKIIAGYQQPMATGERLVPEIEAVGIPVGLYTSPWFLNFFFQDLDHKISEKCGLHHYVRYVDDIVLFDTSKRKLHKAVKFISKELEAVNMRLKHTWQVFRLKFRPLDFLGYRFHTDHVSLRKTIMHRMSRKARIIAKKDYISLTNASGMVSYMGYIKATDSYRFWEKYIRPYVNIKQLKGVISHENRKQLKTAAAV